MYICLKVLIFRPICESFVWRSCFMCFSCLHVIFICYVIFHIVRDKTHSSTCVAPNGFRMLGSLIWYETFMVKLIRVWSFHPLIIIIKLIFLAEFTDVVCFVHASSTKVCLCAVEIKFIGWYVTILNPPPTHTHPHPKKKRFDNNNLP